MGRIKDYLIWHEEKYGYAPENLSRVSEFLEDERREREEWEAKTLPAQKFAELIVQSPSLKLLEAIKEQKLSLHELDWMQFEDIVADLLSRDGYKVKLGKRRQDGGVDIFAEKKVNCVGQILTVWQAKKLKETNKVSISTIRELADTRSEFKASKGIIVTNTSLTKGAIVRIARDRYLLDKIDGDELIEWIMRTPLT